MIPLRWRGKALDTKHTPPVVRVGRALDDHAWVLPPARVTEIELAAPLAPLRPVPGAPDVAWVVALVRLHSQPLGLATLRLEAGAADTGSIAAAIEQQHGAAIRAHFEQDGLPMARPVPGAPFPWPDSVPCLAARRALLASAPPVTVVVPVVDRPDLLRRCLDDLAAQSYARRIVLVVDNAPESSGAAAVVEQHGGARDGIRYVIEPRRGSSAARNRGLAVSATEITAFVDADVRIDRHWLAELVLPIAADPGVGCATGLILPASLLEPGERLMFAWGGYEQGFVRRTHSRSVPSRGAPLHPYQPGIFGSGQSMAFRTDVLRGIGGFDLALGVRTASQGGEDQGAMLDVVLDGWRLVYTPGAIVWHPDPATEHAVIRKLNSYGVGLTALLARTLLRRPTSALDIARRLPAAMRFFFSGRSERNRRHVPGYPKSAVWRSELRGMAWGPFAYVIAAAGARRPRLSRLLPGR